MMLQLLANHWHRSGAELLSGRLVVCRTANLKETGNEAVISKAPHPRSFSPEYRGEGSYGWYGVRVCAHRWINNVGRRELWLGELKRELWHAVGVRAYVVLVIQGGVAALLTLGCVV
jgi:hypothetical protein